METVISGYDRTLYVLPTRIDRAHIHSRSKDERSCLKAKRQVRAIGES